jgi:hypothetical protein
MMPTLTPGVHVPVLGGSTSFYVDRWNSLQALENTQALGGTHLPCCPLKGRHVLTIAYGFAVCVSRVADYGS